MIVAVSLSMSYVVFSSEQQNAEQTSQVCHLIDFAFSLFTHAVVVVVVAVVAQQRSEMDCENSGALYSV
jgi:hypothetical protein